MRRKQWKGYMPEVLALAQEGKVRESSAAALEALNYYEKKVKAAFNPYPTADAPFIMFVLRSLAENLEDSAPNTVKMYEALKESVTPARAKITSIPLNKKGGIFRK